MRIDRVNLTGTTQNEKLTQVNRRRDANDYVIMFIINKISGSGTVAIQVSPDGGTTKVALKDEGGNAISATDSATFIARIPNGTEATDPLTLYADLSSGTSADFNVDAFDNR